MAMRETIEALLPPENNPVKRWRQLHAVLVGVLLCHMAWAQGAFTYLGLGDGFARASDVKHLTTLVMQNGLEDAKKEYCEAVSRKDVMGQMYWGNHLAVLQDTYNERTGRMYPLPPCPKNGHTT